MKEFRFSNLINISILILCFIFLSIYGCASPASKAIKRGENFLSTKNYYGAAEEFLNALSSEPNNQKAKIELNKIAQKAYDQKLDIAKQYENSSDFEAALKEYNDLSSFIDRARSHNCLNFATINTKQKIEEMKYGASEKYYKEAEIFFSNSNYEKAIENYQEALKHNKPYKDSENKISESYYRLAKELVSKNKYRKASGLYMKADNINHGYKDAEALASKYKIKADEQDAQRNYEKGMSLVQQEDFREAAEHFDKAASFVSDFKDAQTLASKYRSKANNKDANENYEKGLALAKSEKFRDAVMHFDKAASFVSDFKDAQTLASKYERKADERDAKAHYEKGKKYMVNNDFQEAKKEFLAANNYIEGYKDALELAEKAKNAMPNEKQIAKAVEQALQENIPVSWVGNLMGGKKAKLSTVEIVEIGNYNNRSRYWPMRIHVVGRCLLCAPFQEDEVVSFDEVGAFRFWKDDYGDWVARLQGGQYQ